MPEAPSQALDLDVHLDAIRAGDPVAFGRWVAGAERPLRDTLRGFATRVDTEAVVQEALLRVWQVAPRFEPDGRQNGLLRLAVRIGRNLAISETRRLRAEPLPDDAAVPDDASPAPPDPLLRRHIEECRGKLPRKPASALAQRLSDGGASSDADLASRLGMTLNTFLQNFTRARRLLADCLARRGVRLDLGGGRA